MRQMNQIDQNTITLIICAAVTAFLVVWWVRGRMLRNRARQWPTAAGKVAASNLQLEPRGNTQSAHVATINYSYEALGTAHHGVWKRSTMLHGKAQGWIDKHPLGAKLSVRYDPNTPGSSVILDADQA
jgi:hypothetical protein